MARSFTPSGSSSDAIEKKLVQMKPGGKRLPSGLKTFNDAQTGSLSSSIKKVSPPGVPGRSFAPPKMATSKPPTKKGKLQSEDLRKAVSRRLTKMHKYSRNRAF